MTVTRDGRRVDAVAQTTKHGFVFLFDRATGTPLFPIEERPVPGQRRATASARRRRSRMPTKPAPFARQRLTEDMLTHADARGARRGARGVPRASAATASSCRSSVGGETVVFPGFDGGGEWGGPAFDPRDAACST